MADYWDQFQPYMTAEQALAPMGRQLSRTATTTVAPTAPSTSLPGNSMGFSPDQEAAIRQWSATGGAPTGTAGEGSKEAVLKFIADWQASHPATPDAFQQLATELQTRYGIQRAPGAIGPSNNEFDIFGEKVKVMAGEDSGSPSWFAYGADDGWRPGGETGGLPAGYSLNGGPLSSFSAPGLAAPWTQEFQRPDPQSILNDPSYQFIRDEGIRGAKTEAAALGTINTGGMLRDLAQYGSGLASTYDDKYYNRSLGEYQMNRDSFWNNQNNAFNKLSDFSQLGLNAATATGNFASGYANNAQTGASNLGNLATNQANANGRAEIAGANATNAAATGVANTLGEIDWSTLFRRRTPRPSPGITNPVGYDENL